MSQYALDHFYNQFKSAQSFQFVYPVDEEGIGPYWLESGDLDPSKANDLAEAPIMAVDLGGGRYQMADIGSLLTGMRINWGDVFFADKSDDNSLTLTRVALPFKYKHFDEPSRLGLTSDDFCQAVHDAGGGWMAEFNGLLLLISIPVENLHLFNVQPDQSESNLT